MDVDGTYTPTSRFNLDTVIESEGSNLSVGERSLLSLARALVKDSQVVGTYHTRSPACVAVLISYIVLDEAT